MQLRINLPDTLTQEKTFQLIKEIENTLSKEGISLESSQKLLENSDSWDELNMSEIAVDTGIEDFAKNHDRYLSGTAQK